MLIGVLSDTHDHRQRFSHAIGIFKKMHVDLILHAGDFCSPFTALDWPETPWCEFIGVFGNNDGDRSALSKAWVRRSRLNKEEEILETDSGLLFLVHDPIVAEKAFVSGRYRFVIHGHTHKWSMQQATGNLMLNPGECCGWLHGKATVALLDTKNCSALQLELP